MNSVNKFRVAAIVVAVLAAGYAIASVFPEIFLPRHQPLPSDLSTIAVQAPGPAAQWVAAIAPFRPDLAPNYASTMALMALRPDDAALSAADSPRNLNSQSDVVPGLD